MADIIYHNGLAEYLKGSIDLENDTLRVALLDSNYTPDSDHYEWPEVSGYELSNGNGYTVSGELVTGATVTDDDAQNSGIFDIDNIEWTAAGGTIGPARYGILYDESTVTQHLLYLFDFSEEKSAVDTANFRINIDSNGVFSVAQQG